ncbi:MAG: alpha/beta fold hydrolase [Actinomycetota bacterium]|nr:alpha/beta fold hydrolase [Actinomycetota bacterium]
MSATGDRIQFRTNGITLSAIDHGGPASGRPTLILSPGLTANAHFFDAIVRGLVPDIRVIALDLRGRGQSDKPANGYTMADHAADVLGVLDEFGIERALIGGHSFGGLLTYYLAARHCERVDRCVVLDAPAHVDPALLDQIGPALERLGAVMPSFDAYLAAVRSAPYYEGWWDEQIEDYFRADVEELTDGRVRARSHPDHIQQSVEGSMQLDWPALVATITQPTLLVRAMGPFGPPGSPPILGEGAAAATIGLLGDAKLLEVTGNHMTGFYGGSAKVVADAIRRFVLL